MRRMCEIQNPTRFCIEPFFFHFNPRPSYEERPAACAVVPATGVIFQSTPLIRGATLKKAKKSSIAKSFQSTPLIRGATPLELEYLPTGQFQSTPLIRGATGGKPNVGTGETAFQSTPLIRGATVGFSAGATAAGNFNPRPSYEERPRDKAALESARKISIHAPHTRSDVPRRLRRCNGC